MSLSVLEPGLYSLIVDSGRPGSRSLGVPVGGAADRSDFQLGNALLGNTPDAPALEVALRGPTLRANYLVACVVFGAPFELRVNQSPMTAGTTFTLEPGDVLRIGGTPSGARGYLCVAGGFDAPAILGSRSALEPLKVGEELTCLPSRIAGRSLPFLSLHEEPTGGEHLLRVLDGPQRDWFENDDFWTASYAVTPASNRMGLRLTGAKLARRAGEMVSEAVAPGAVQVANDQQPIVLGVDGQTIGGYPKIAHVIRADLDRLAQLRPGDHVRFQRVDEGEAESAAKARVDRLNEWQRRLALGEGKAVFP